MISAGLMKLRITLEMIRFEHSIFALPFALTGAMLAVRGWPGLRELGWIILAMVGARSAGMTFNRIADHHLDARNPRTANRALPQQQISVGFAGIFTAIASAVLLLAASQLHPLAFKLSPLVLVILFAYSYTKRFTHWSHLILGFCLGMGPVGGQLALRGEVTPGVMLLGVAVMFWVAGFDMIYACQDVKFDREAGLHSFPKSFGVHASLRASRGLHILMLAVLAAVVWVERLGWLSVAGLVVVGILLAYEHSLVRPDDLARVNAAFFTVNGFISVLFFAFWAADLWLMSGGA